MESCVFLNLHSPPLPSQRDWRSILKHHVNLKDDRAILKSFSEMAASDVFPTRDQLPVALKACGRLQNIDFGRSMNSFIVKFGLVEDVKIITALINFYCKCGFFDIACGLFDAMGERDLVSWNAMISSFVENSRNVDAFLLFLRMRSAGLKPNAVTLVGLLLACREMSGIRVGREIHCYCLRNGFFDSEVRVGTALVDFYSRFDARASRTVFDLMEVRNTVSWNVVLYAFGYSGEFDEGVNMFIYMLVDGAAPDSVTFLAILESCSDPECLNIGNQVHQLVIKHGFAYDKFVANALIVMYGKCGDVESSYLVFENMLSADIASWNAMLTSYRNCACFRETFLLFRRMLEENVEENPVTLATMLSVCGQSDNLKKGKELHCYAIKSGSDKAIGVENSLLSMYIESSSISSACTVFNKMDISDVVSWNILIMGLIHNGYTSEAWELFGRMKHSDDMPNSFTMVSLLAGCKEKSSMSVGRSIHGYIIRHELDVNPSLRSALSDMYVSCGHESAAVHLFWNYSARDVVSWNAMIASYFRAGQHSKALSLFYQMQSEVTPSSTTMIIALLSCASTANLSKGRCFHAYICRRELTSDSVLSLGNALLTMYAKCGSLQDAKNIFMNLTKKDVITWNAMIAAYGMHGDGNNALDVFYQMLKAGERPNSVTFISILSCCSHSGLVEKGWELFHCMVEDCGITPQMAHYGCMVDLLGRAGLLHAAMKLINSMPMEPDPNVWRALLSASQLSRNLPLAIFVAQKLIELEPLNVGNYIHLSNIYAAAGRWEAVRALRRQLKERGLQKVPGSSWMAIRNQIHSFTAGNKICSEYDAMCENQKNLLDDFIKALVKPCLA